MENQDEVVNIVVLGSINIDLVACCQSLPLPGQTLTATSFAEIPGGKGANQAVAASRAGATVSMIGRVGSDLYGGQLVDGLQREGIGVDSIQTSPGPSGVAMITVADDGENQIIVVPGANGCMKPSDVVQHESLIAAADVLLLQLEVPIDCVLLAIEVAKANDTRVILDPAPAVPQWPEQLLHVDLICPNETEAAALIGEPVESRSQIEAAARKLHARGAAAVAITLGAEGTLLFDGDQMEMVQPFPVDAIDATAAGDAFVGALAVHWAQANDLSAAIRFGNAAGCIAASRSGAQHSLPTRSEIIVQCTHNEGAN